MKLKKGWIQYYDRINMASCWSDTKLLDKTADIYLKSNAQNKTNAIQL